MKLIYFAAVTVSACIYASSPLEQVTEIFFPFTRTLQPMGAETLSIFNSISPAEVSSKRIFSVDFSFTVPITVDCDEVSTEAEELSFTPTIDAA